MPDYVDTEAGIFILYRVSFLPMNFPEIEFAIIGDVVGTGNSFIILLIKQSCSTLLLSSFKTWSRPPSSSNAPTPTVIPPR